MNLYIDCEFNSFRGALISMALVPRAGAEFYEVLPYAACDSWVEQHVIPVLQRYPVSLEVFQQRLAAYLSAWPHGVHVIADWPADLQHFCWVLETTPGSRIATPPITLEIRQGLDSAASRLPHNALEDARAIRDQDCAQLEFQWLATHP